MVKPQWSMRERVTYFDNEKTKGGLPSVDEMVAINANVHLEKMDDQSFMLIVESSSRYWHFVIGSRSGRTPVEAFVFEEEKR